jgi:dTDP-4-dehydrorhamnose reductase
MRPIRFLVLGDGLLGSEIVKQTGWRYFSRKKDGIDITKTSSYANLLAKYTHVINCIGYTDTRDNTPDKHMEVNVKGVYYLAKLCEGFHNKLIHISTDYVYAFSPQNATEKDLPVTLPNWYGHSKVMADSLIQAMFPDEQSYLILRGTFKPTPYTHEKAWYNLTGNFDYVDVMANLMIRLIMNDAYGIYNVGTEKKNLYELAKRTKPDVQMDEGMYSHTGYHRPYNTTMNLTKMNEFFDAIKR